MANNDEECEFGVGGGHTSDSSSSLSSEEEFVDCPCGLKDDKERFMIECPACRMWQHANCVNIWDPLSPIMQSYVCFRCLKVESNAYKVRDCYWVRIAGSRVGSCEFACVPARV